MQVLGVILLSVFFGLQALANQCENYLAFDDVPNIKKFAADIDGFKLHISGSDATLHEVYDSTSSRPEDQHVFVLSRVKAYIDGEKNFLGRPVGYQLTGDLDEICRQITGGRYPFERTMYSHNLGMLFPERVMMLSQNSAGEFKIQTSAEAPSIQTYVTNLFCGSTPDSW